MSMGHFGNNGKEYLKKDESKPNYFDSVTKEILKLKSLPYTPARKLEIQRLQQRLNELDNIKKLWQKMILNIDKVEADIE